MFEIRRSSERGHFNHGWLDTYHTFSFGEYYDPQQMRFRTLRVINEDRVQPGQGFATHGHRDMEIITYVLSGTLTHRDSLGHGGEIQAGELQHMTAGTGIMHSESNESAETPVHLYQIWIFPESRGLEPSYDQKSFPEAERPNQLRVVASPDGRNGSLTIRQNALLSLGSLSEGARVEIDLAPNRHGWLQVLRGQVQVQVQVHPDGHDLEAGDGAAISELPSLTVTAKTPSEILFFDLA